MLIKPKEIDLKSINGFTNGLDIFKRRTLGESLANLLMSTEENLVIGIDSQWGEGKSMFARMFSAHLTNEKNISNIYFDAFENDYQRDPFLTIVTEINDLIGEESPKLKTEFRNSALKASKAIARGALRIGIKTVSAGLFDGTTLSELEEAGAIGSELSQGLDRIVEQKLDENKSDKAALENFKITLENHVLNIGGGKPVVFIIDELDRCRPDYSLELIENIKHLFTVKNLKFILITNKTQTNASIKKRYGQEIDAHIYLQKFVDLWISLPRTETPYVSDTSTYIRHLINQTTTPEEKIKNQTSLEILKDIFAANKTSFRGIQKTLSYFAIFHNSDPKTEYYDYYQAMVAISCYSKVENPKIMTAIMQREDHKKITSMLFPSQPTGNRIYTREFTALIIKYLTSGAEEQERMIKEKEFQTDFGRAIPEDCLQQIQNTLSLFSQ